jgi:hypothetical protein
MAVAPAKSRELLNEFHKSGHPEAALIGKTVARHLKGDGVRPAGGLLPEKSRLMPGERR